MTLYHIVGANRIRLPVIQAHFPICETMVTPLSGYPTRQVFEYPVETRCSRLLPDRFQCIILPLSPDSKLIFTKCTSIIQCHSPRHRRHLPYIFKNIFRSNIHLQIRTKTDKTNNCKTSSLNQVPLHDNMAFEKGKIQDSINSPPPIWANR